MMVTFEEALKRVVDEAEAVSTKMSVEDKARITKAGAKVFKEVLQAEVKKRHYRDRKTGEDPHLADGIVIKNKNIDGVKDGTSTVGWEKSTTKGTRTKGYIAHIINDGSRFPQFTTASGRKYKKAGEVAVRADHFIEETRNNPAVKKAILEAEAKALRRIVNRRNKEKK
nr:HK97 gp10 family phage protein [Lactococcus lactis]